MAGKSVSAWLDHQGFSDMRGQREQSKQELPGRIQFERVSKPALQKKFSRSVHARIQQLQFSALLPRNSARALLAGIVCRT
jgi:hypothetical protein